MKSGPVGHKSVQKYGTQIAYVNFEGKYRVGKAELHRHTSNEAF